MACLGGGSGLGFPGIRGRHSGGLCLPSTKHNSRSQTLSNSMISIRLCWLSLALPFAANAAFAAPTLPTVTLDVATVLGRPNGTVVQYLGLPFAQPPCVLSPTPRPSFFRHRPLCALHFTEVDIDPHSHSRLFMATASATCACASPSPSHHTQTRQSTRQHLGTSASSRRSSHSRSHPPYPRRPPRTPPSSSPLTTCRSARTVSILPALRFPVYVRACEAQIGWFGLVL